MNSTPSVIIPINGSFTYANDRQLLSTKSSDGQPLCTAFQRTALTDVEIGDVTIRQGQRAGLFYSSANFDEDVFNDPFKFDISRSPNPHLAFGGNGAHYCIGANLARMEIRLIFNEIAAQLPSITKLAEPVRPRSGWINGVKELRVSYHG